MPAEHASDQHTSGTQQPASALDPAALTDVSFARRSHGCPKPRASDQAPVLLMAYAAIGVATPLFALFSFLPPILPAGLPQPLWLMVIPIFVFGVFAIRRFQGWGSIPKFADPARRIHVLLPPRAVLRNRSLHDDDFEPEALQAFLPAPRRWWEWLLLAAMCVAGFMLALRIFGVRPMQMAIGGAGLAGVLGLAALGVWRQTWFRFSPGRMDILEFRPFRQTPTSARSYDLRSAPIVLDPVWRRMVIDADGRAESVSLGGFWRFDLAIHHILRAAVSTAPTPDLPMDRLHD
jgi:hypothetical protein